MSGFLIFLLIFASPILLMALFGKASEISDKAKKNRQDEQEKSNYLQGFFDSVGELHDGIAIAKIGNKYTYVKQIERPDGTRKWVKIGKDSPYIYGIKYLLYVHADDFSYGTGIAQKENGQYVLVDKEGCEHCESKHIFVVGPNLVAVEISESAYSLVNKSNCVTIASGFKSIGQFQEGRSIVENPKGKTVIDTQGRQLFPYYSDILMSTNDSVVFSNETYGWSSSNPHSNLWGVYSKSRQKITIECENAIVLYDSPTQLWFCGQRLDPSFRKSSDITHYSYRWKVYNADYEPITEWIGSVEILNNQYLVYGRDRYHLGLYGLNGEKLLSGSYSSFFCSTSSKYVVGISRPLICTSLSLYNKNDGGLKFLSGFLLPYNESILNGHKNGESQSILYEHNSYKTISIYEDRDYINVPKAEWSKKSSLRDGTRYYPSRIIVAKEDERPGFRDCPGKRGVLSISEGRLLIPCNYNIIEDWGIGFRLVKEDKSLWLNSDKLDSFNDHLLEYFEHKADEHRYLFFDTETTGLPRSQSASTKDSNAWPHIVQLSWILSDKEGHIIGKHNYIIQPEGFKIPYTASQVHGITQEIALEKGVPLKEAMYVFLKDVDSADSLVGHNLDFDCKMISAELNRTGAEDILVNKIHRDTMKESAEYYGEKGNYGNYKWPKLQNLYQRLFGEEFANAHDSSSDVEATFKCFWELVKRNVIDSKEAKLIFEYTPRYFSESTYDDDLFFPPDDEDQGFQDDIFY